MLYSNSNPGVLRQEFVLRLGLFIFFCGLFLLLFEAHSYSERHARYEEDLKRNRSTVEFLDFLASRLAPGRTIEPPKPPERPRIESTRTGIEGLLCVGGAVLFFLGWRNRAELLKQRTDPRRKRGEPPNGPSLGHPFRAKAAQASALSPPFASADKRASEGSACRELPENNDDLSRQVIDSLREGCFG